MKSVFISYNQALSELVLEILDRQSIKGYTQWNDVMGRGSRGGEPHFGSHTWPAKNVAVLAMVDDHRVEPLLAKLKELDDKTEQQGLRAFVWHVEQSI